MDNDWQRKWREYLNKIAYERAMQRLLSYFYGLSHSAERLKAQEWASWPRPHPNPPEMTEIERDIFLRYVDEILQDEKAKRGR